MKKYYISLKSFGRFLNTQFLQLNKKNLKIVLTGLLFFIALAGNATVYYVSSSSGNDSNSGTNSDSPWKTLSKVNSFSFKAGDQILFKKGDEWNGTITVGSSGTSSSPIVYGAYGTGSKPKIYGSEKISNWTRHTGNIYKASFSKAINQLFLNDGRMRAARYPNSGYIFITSTESSTRFTSDDLDPGINYSGAKWFGRTYYYTADLKDISSSSSKSITLSSAPRKDLKNGLGFFLMNKLEFLDKAGEWYYDSNSNTVYLWTPNGDSPENYTIRGSVHKDGFYLNYNNYITIQDIEILQHSEKGINLNRSDYITINNNDLLYPDGFGIYTPSNSKNYSITNNKVTGANHYGMMIRISHSTISDNVISKIALHQNIGLTGTGEDNYGGGIYLAGEDGNNKLRYNRITETGYNGILFAKPNNIIEYNYINGACLLKGDMGGIYTSWYNRVAPTGPEGSIIRHNIILNVVGEKYGYTSLRDFGEGIYIDESARGVTIENNTIAYCKNSGIYLHQTENTLVRNNSILDARQSILINKSSGSIKSNINNNLLVAASDKDDYLQRQVLVNFQSGNAILDYNKYINPYASDGIFKMGSPYYSFTGWKSASGQDKNSAVNVTALKTGEKEKLFYNDTKSDKTINLGSRIYKDTDGKQVTGSFILKPFTSRILIETSSGTAVVENQSPVVLDQNFEFLAPKKTNDFIGQVVANDPDAGQELTYTIVDGNEDGFFKLDASTGNIYALTEIASTVSKNVSLNVKVQDNASSPLSANAVISINIKSGTINQTSDLTAPTISLFSVPSTSSSLVIPVTVNATDDKGVTGWIVCETSTVPTVSDSRWVSTAPIEYLCSGEGARSLHAWAKDASGNISSPVTKSVTITLPDDNKNTSDSVEYVTICEGQEYLGWTSSGTYERTVSKESSAVSAGTNLIGNSDFSLGSTGWSTWGDTGYSISLSANNSDYHSAPSSLQVKCNANSTSISKLQLTSQTNITVEAGKEYELTFQAKASVPFEIKKFVLMKRTSPYTHYGSFSGVLPSVTTGWSQFKMKFTATATASDGSFRIYLGSSFPVGSILLLDDIVLSEISNETVVSTQVIVTQLTVNPTQYTTEEITITEGESYLGWKENGVYTRTAESSTGCDHVITTNLTVVAPSNPEVQYATEYTTICEGEAYNGWTQSGEYQSTVTSDTGQEVIMTTYLTVVATIYITETVKLWEGESYNGWTEPGYYERVLEAASGCDSIVVTKIIIRGKSPGSNESTLDESSPVISKNNINNDNLDIVGEGGFLIYPNPAQTFINVEYKNLPDIDTRLEIIDGAGRIVQSQQVESYTNRIEFNQLNPGMYYLRSVNKQLQQVEKFIIQ